MLQNIRKNVMTFSDFDYSDYDLEKVSQRFNVLQLIVLLTDRVSFTMYAFKAIVLHGSFLHKKF